MARSDARSKGARTAEKILDAAESLFAERGFDGTSLREIARAVGIAEPGIYNHYRGKQALYSAVIDRALAPMLEAMDSAIADPDSVSGTAMLPAVMVDQLAAHPQMAALFQQAMQTPADTKSGRHISTWLDRLFRRGLAILDDVDAPDLDPSDRAIRVIALFNLTTGYFLSQRVFERLVDSDADLAHPAHLARQKRLVVELARAAMGS